MKNQNKLLLWHLTYIIAFSLLIFVSGLYATTKLEVYNLTEDTVINESFLGEERWQEYQDFKNSYPLSQGPVNDLLNFFALTGLLWIFYKSWNYGYNSPPTTLYDTFISYSIVFIMVFYLVSIVLGYLINIFVDQLVLQLYSDIYYSIWAFQIEYQWFIGMVLASYVLMWLGNEVKYFSYSN